MSDDLTPFDPEQALVEDLAAIDFDAEPEPLTDTYALNGRMRALARESRLLEQFDADAERFINEMHDQIARQRAPRAKRVQWLSDSLALSHAGIYAADDKATTVVLPAGDLSSKAGGVEWVWADDDALLLWAAKHLPDAVDQKPAPKPTVDKNAVKKALAAGALADKPHPKAPQAPRREDGAVVHDGQVVPGVRVVAKPRTFEAKPYTHEITGGPTP